MVRVVVADDHALVREGISGLIDTADDLEVVGTAGDLDGLFAEVDRTRPDVVVTDIRMPPSGDDEGLQAAARLRDAHPGTGVVVLSMYADPHYARRLLGDGTAGRAYLLKSRVQATDELLRAIRTVARGGSIVDPAIVESLLDADRSTPHRRLDRLTTRERDVLALMAAGASNTSIAVRLGVTGKTVESHIGSIFTKLDLLEETTVSRRVAAVLAWLEQSSTA